LAAPPKLYLSLQPVPAFSKIIITGKPVKIERTKHSLVQTRKRVLSRQPSVSSFFDAFSLGWFRLFWQAQQPAQPTATKNNEQKTTNNEQRTTNNEQQTTNNEQRTTNTEQQTPNNFPIPPLWDLPTDGCTSARSGHPRKVR
jgi:hypothetical protein